MRHRLPPPPSALRGRVVAAAVAAGAFAAAGAGQTVHAAAKEVHSANGGATFDGTGGGTRSAPQVLVVSRATPEGAAEAAKLLRSQQITARRETAEAENKRPKFARPAVGDFTSAYGARWGRTHLGIDIAGPIGTPILATADGHVDTYSVRTGQRVQAGQQIARMGNRGESTGPHLHFEVWNPAGNKINPIPWLNDRGITV